MRPNKATNVDDYISTFPENVQILLKQVRSTIQKAAPEATEDIKYGMPAYLLDGNLVYFAAFKHHIGLYALPSGNIEFQKELKIYKTGKGSIQFPFNQPMPLELITKIVNFRIAENKAKSIKAK